MSDSIISVEHVFKAVTDSTGTLEILRDIDFALNARETAAIVGASGSGKSTLLSIIAGLDTPTRGTVTVQGRPAAELGRAGASSRVGMLFQHGALFSAFTVLENIAFPLRERGTLPPALVRDVAMVKLQMVGLDPKHAHKMPSDLSGGMIKRVALARALAMDPPLLLLDEPTAGLDLVARQHFLELMRSLAQRGITLVLVTHHIEEIIPEIDRVLLLRDGAVCADGDRAGSLSEAQLSHAFGGPVQVRQEGEYYGAVPGHA